jgi:hypothetical protein
LTWKKVIQEAQIRALFRGISGHQQELKRTGCLGVVTERCKDNLDAVSHILSFALTWNQFLRDEKPEIVAKLVEPLKFLGELVQQRFGRHKHLDPELQVLQARPPLLFWKICKPFSLPLHRVWWGPPMETPLLP